MKTKIRWAGKAKFEVETPSGHQLTLDGPPEIGGENQGPRPMEMLLVGLGACSAVDVIHILKKSRQAVSDCYLEVDGQRATTEPKVFTDIHLHYVVTGENLQPNKVARAVELSATKYCSASIMLEKTANITHDFEIIDTK